MLRRNRPVVTELPVQKGDEIREEKASSILGSYQGSDGGAAFVREPGEASLAVTLHGASITSSLAYDRVSARPLASPRSLGSTGSWIW